MGHGGTADGRRSRSSPDMQEDAGPRLGFRAAAEDCVVIDGNDQAIELVATTHLLVLFPVLLNAFGVEDPVVVGGLTVVDAAPLAIDLLVGERRRTREIFVVAIDAADSKDTGRASAITFSLNRLVRLRARAVKPASPTEAGVANDAHDRFSDLLPRAARFALEAKQCGVGASPTLGEGDDELSIESK